MEENPLKILLIDDAPEHHTLLSLHLKRAFENIEIIHATTLGEARRLLETELPDLALIDLNLPDGYGDELLSDENYKGQFPMVIMTSHGDESIAVEAMKNGASDYVVKSEAAFADISHLVTRALNNWKNLQGRVAAENELRKSESKYRRLSQEFQTILEGISDAISLVDKDMKLIWANRVAIESAIHQNHKSANVNCYEVWQGRTEQCENCPVHRSFTTGKPAEEVVEYPNKRIWSKRSFPLKNVDGSVASVVLVAEDITEKVQLRAEAMRSSQLAALGELAAGVGHEINNPLNGVINYAQMLIDHDLEGEQQELARLIIKEGQRMANIVSNLLTFSRKPLEESHPMSITTALDGVLKLTAVKLRHDNIKIRVRTEDDLPQVLGNFQQIQQVLMNVINNASYALNEKSPGSHDNKKLFVDIKVHDTGEQSWLRTTIIDFGTGMSKEVLNKIFDPFYTTKPQGSGTGLGMNISEGIVRNHGGQIKYASKFGFWTRVTIDLPVSS